MLTMVLPRKMDTVTLRILEISQYLSPFASIFPDTFGWELVYGVALCSDVVFVLFG